MEPTTRRLAAITFSALVMLFLPLTATASEVILAVDITTDTTLTADNTYLVPSAKQLFVKSGAILTIEPGSLIKFDQAASLVIARGSKIEAVGTAEEPIVFTSAQPFGEQTSGFWGGVILLGAAPINVNVNSQPPSNQACYEAINPALPECNFGGNTPADDSGTLRYVRIEFGGASFVADRKFNNLTLGGVGSGTEIDFVQSHRGADDGIEIFGGTVNLKHIVSSQNEDEGLAFDNGWTGMAQFIVVQHVVPDATVMSSDGLDSQNHGSVGSYTAEPLTGPTIFNATFVGNPAYAVGSGSFAAVLRRGTGGKYANVVMIDFPKGIEVRDPATQAQLDVGNLYIKNSILFNNDALGDGDNWPPPQPMNDIDEASYFELIPWANQFVNPGLPAARADLESPSFAPITGAAVFSGGATPTANGFFDPAATFIGAIGSNDWTGHWTSYEPLVLVDGFETSDTSRWSSTVSGL